MLKCNNSKGSMADQLQKPIFKRRREREQKPEATRQKRNKNNKSDNAKGAAAINNICYDVPEHIFDLLDLQSLLNMANTCKHLEIAATTTFAHKFGHRRFVLFSNGNPGIGAARQGFAIHDDKICVYAPSILPFLRCFGAGMPNLVVGRIDNPVNKYINRYCAGSLTSIEFRNFTKELTKKSFPKLFKAARRGHNQCKCIVTSKNTEYLAL